MEYTLVLRGRKLMQRSTHSKYSLNRINVKKRQEICRNVQELRFKYSHFNLTNIFQNSRKKGKKEKKLSFRSSLSEVFYKKGVLKNFAKFTGKQCARLARASFFNEVAGLRPAILLKIRLWHRCFSATFARFFRRPFFKEHIWWLLLYRKP